MTRAIILLAALSLVAVLGVAAWAVLWAEVVMSGCANEDDKEE